MKASLKFRDDHQLPLARAKIPFNILGLPFLAGASAGDPSDLRLDLATAFESGPALRVSYRPTQPLNPLTLSIKTGIYIGAFGSPAAAPFSMKTEFNLFSSNRPSESPVVSVIFKSRLGDFCFRKSASSSMFSGLEVTARSVVPICGRADVGFRWGFRMPAGLRSSFSMNNLPAFVMNKISVKLIPAGANSKLVWGSGINVDAGEVTRACKSARQDILALRIESGALRMAVEHLRDRIDSRFPSGNKDCFGAEAGKGGLMTEAGLEWLKRERRSEMKSVSENVNEELKKAFMSAGAPGKEGRPLKRWWACQTSVCKEGAAE